MRSTGLAAVVFMAVSLVVLGVLGGRAVTAQDTGQCKYTVQGPNGLAVILANPAMINAYQSGIPGNGKPFPDGAKMARIHWNPKKMETFPDTTVPSSPRTGRGERVLLGRV